MDVAEFLTSIGLEKYVAIFIGEGFDDWSTFIDATESDL